MSLEQQRGYAFSLRRGVEMRRGSNPWSFSRSTVATVLDHDKVPRKAKINEVRFRGARRVENLMRYSEDFSNATWLKLGTGTPATATLSAVTPPPGFRDCYLLDVSTAADARIAQSITPPSWGRYILSFWVRSVSGTGTWGYILNSGGATVNIDTTWRRVQTTYDFPGPANINIYPANRGAGGTLLQALVTGVQLEFVGGATNLTVASEYVSQDSIGAPFFGAGVDGVRYFDALCANTAASNVITEVTANVPIPEANLLGMMSEVQSSNYEQNTATQTVTLLTSAADGDVMGGSTGFLLTETGGTGAHFSYQASLASPIIGTAYTLSAYVKRGTANKIQITPSANWGASNYYANFDLVAGTLVGQGAGNYAAGIAPAGNGWFRIWMTCLATTTSSGAAIIIATIANDNDPRLATKADQGWTFYRSCGQVEPTRIPTSYIPTTNATVTRTNDALTVRSTKSGGVNAIAVSMIAEISLDGIDNNPFYNVAVSQIDAGNKVALYWYQSGLIFEKRVATTAYTSNAACVATANTLFKVGGVGSLARGVIAGAKGALGPYNQNALAPPFAFGPTLQIGSNMYGTIKSFESMEYDIPSADLAGATR